MTAYYNEFEPYAAQWLRNLIAAGHIAPGDVDERSILDVQPDDLRGYAQVHFFAGIGGWSYAARLAGWPDDRPLWTGSCPCQPFSVAGKGGAQKDERHLWPVFFDLIRARRPDVVMGEQVAAAVGKDWLDGVSSDLESIGYACGAAVVPACAVDAPHRRDRLWFVADASFAGERRYAREPRGETGEGRGEARAQNGDASGGACGPRGARHDDLGAYHVADALGAGLAQREREPGVSCGLGGEPEGQNPADDACAMGDADRSRPRARSHDPAARHRHPSPANERSRAWHSAQLLLGADGKARRVEPGVRLLAHGVPARVGKLRAYGNAIVPQVAAEVIAAYMDCRP